MKQLKDFISNSPKNEVLVSFRIPLEEGERLSELAQYSEISFSAAGRAVFLLGFSHWSDEAPQ